MAGWKSFKCETREPLRRILGEFGMEYYYEFSGRVIRG